MSFSYEPYTGESADYSPKKRYGSNSDRETAILGEVETALSDIVSAVKGYVSVSCSGHVMDYDDMPGDSLNLQVTSLLRPSDPTPDAGLVAAAGSAQSYPPEASTAAPATEDASPPAAQAPIPQPAEVTPDPTLVTFSTPQEIHPEPEVVVPPSSPDSPLPGGEVPAPPTEAPSPSVAAPPPPQQEQPAAQVPTPSEPVGGATPEQHAENPEAAAYVDEVFKGMTDPVADPTPAPSPVTGPEEASPGVVEGAPDPMPEVSPAPSAPEEHVEQSGPFSSPTAP